MSRIIDTPTRARDRRDLCLGEGTFLLEDDEPDPEADHHDGGRAEEPWTDPPTSLGRRMAALRSVLRFALATTALRTSEAPTQMIAQYGLLGGDLNILANPWPNDPVRDRHLMVVSRIKAYGLVDCS